MKIPEGMTIHVHGRKYISEIPDNLVDAEMKRIIEKKQSGGVKKPDGNSEGNTRKRSENDA